jgi:hypothetical protein
MDYNSYGEPISWRAKVETHLRDFWPAWVIGPAILGIGAIAAFSLPGAGLPGAVDDPSILLSEMRAAHVELIAGAADAVENPSETLAARMTEIAVLRNQTSSARFQDFHALGARMVRSGDLSEREIIMAADEIIALEPRLGAAFAETERLLLDSGIPEEEARYQARAALLLGAVATGEIQIREDGHMVVATLDGVLNLNAEVEQVQRAVKQGIESTRAAFGAIEDATKLDIADIRKQMESAYGRVLSGRTDRQVIFTTRYDPATKSSMPYQTVLREVPLSPGMPDLENLGFDPFTAPAPPQEDNEIDQGPSFP